MPIPLLGEGIGHLLDIILSIPAAKGGIILVDEIENGFHYSVMEKVWEIIGQFADEYKVQIFATTHSEENIRAAHRAFFNNISDDFIFHRLERINNEIQTVTIEEDLLQTVIEMDAEIR
jgi:AAA15 family ATPase/GTPase